MPVGYGQLLAIDELKKRGITGFAENAANLVTSGIAEPVAGLSGLMALPLGHERATQVINNVRDKFTYQPKSKMGQTMQTSLNTAMQPVAEGVEYVSSGLGDTVKDVTGSELAGAMAYTAPTAAMSAIGFKYAPKGGKRFEIGDINSGGNKQKGAVNIKQKLAQEELERRGITAWHGTPHEVDKFSSQYIGTGEGAQAYGHGLYFAENPSVAKEYKAEKFVDEKGDTQASLDRYTDPESRAKRMVLSNMERQQYVEGFKDYDSQQAIQDAIETFEDNIQRNNKMLSENKGDDFIKNLLNEQNDTAKKAIEHLKTKDPNDFSVKGNLYKVELDIDPDTEMLDWDKPLSQQPEKVQQAAKLMQSYIADYLPKDSYVPAETGGELYRQFQDATHNITDPDMYEMAKYQREASKFLDDFGIKGIKYSDQMSRGAEGGTSNFVIFDDSLIRIAEKNGVPFEQVEKMAKEKGISKQQALALLVGGKVGEMIMSGQAQSPDES